jgi:hypothetical protein
MSGVGGWLDKAKELIKGHPEQGGDAVSGQPGRPEAEPRTLPEPVPRPEPVSKPEPPPAPAHEAEVAPFGDEAPPIDDERT